MPQSHASSHEMLTRLAYEPTVAESGGESRSRGPCARRRPEQAFPLVLLDGMMPEMDGFMVAEKIREHLDLSRATVMMLSSAMPAGATARCGELGVASYLLKPVSDADLMEAILLALGSTGPARVCGSSFTVRGSHRAPDSSGS